MLKDVLFPPRCPVCGDVIPLENRMKLHRFISGVQSGRKGRTEPETLYAAVMCGGCRNIPVYITEPLCKKCGKQLNGTSPDGLCGDCAENERRFEACRCVMTYDETLREIMAGLKYGSRKEYAFPLALMAADALGQWLEETNADILVPVPVHRERLMTRGYNQAELIAEGISLFTGIPVEKKLLVRERRTRVQKELTAAERAANLQNAFRTQGLLSGRTAVIVDDIYTTGATMEACTEALLKAGAVRVFGLCICAGEDKNAR